MEKRKNKKKQKINENSNQTPNKLMECQNASIKLKRLQNIQRKKIRCKPLQITHQTTDFVFSGRGIEIASVKFNDRTHFNCDFCLKLLPETMNGWNWFFLSE